MSVLDIQFDNPERDYASGGMVSGQISILVSEPTTCLGVVLEYWWQANGSGLGDRGNIHKVPINLDTLENNLSSNPPRPNRRTTDTSSTTNTPDTPADNIVDANGDAPVDAHGDAHGDAHVDAHVDANDGDSPTLTRTAVGEGREAILLEPRETYWLPFYFSAPPGPVSYHSDQFTVDWKLRARLYSDDNPLKVERTFIVTPGSADTVNLGTQTTTTPTPRVALPSLAANIGFVLLGVLALVALASYMLPLPADFPRRLADYLSVPAAVVVTVYLIVTIRTFANAFRAKRLYQHMQVDTSPIAVPAQAFDIVLTLKPGFSSPRQRLDTRMIVEAFEQTRSSSQQKRRCVYSQLLEHNNVVDLVSGKTTKVLERFRFPEDTFASFSSEHHSITWHARLEIQFGNLPSYSSHHPITVHPWATPD